MREKQDVEDFRYLLIVKEIRMFLYLFCMQNKLHCLNLDLSQVENGQLDQM